MDGTGMDEMRYMWRYLRCALNAMDGARSWWTLRSPPSKLCEHFRFWRRGLREAGTSVVSKSTAIGKETNLCSQHVQTFLWFPAKIPTFARTSVGVTIRK